MIIAVSSVVLRRAEKEKARRGADRGGLSRVS